MDEKYLIEGQTLTDIANAIREKTEKTDGIVPENMPEEIRSIDTQEDLTEEISEQDSLIASMLAAVASKATPPLPELENPGTAGDLIEGKQLIDGEGNVVVGELVYVDTKDATAAAENIDEGFTAYVNEKKIVGTSKKIDTNDATALSTDIVEGKTAYVGNQKVEGSIPVVTGSETLENPTITDSGDNFVASGTMKQDKVLKKDSSISVELPKVDFGDATAADVLAGKVFTSLEGLGLIGELIPSPEVKYIGSAFDSSKTSVTIGGLSTDGVYIAVAIQFQGNNGTYTDNKFSIYLINKGAVTALGGKYYKRVSGGLQLTEGANNTYSYSGTSFTSTASSSSYVPGAVVVKIG